jgi:oligoendopeptidase F
MIVTLNAPSILSRPERHFLPNDFTLKDWEGLEPLFRDLANRPIGSVQDLKQWMADRSELESLLEEEMGWRYIRMTCDTSNASHADAFNFFVTEIEPNVAPYNDAFNHKYYDGPFRIEISQEPGIKILDKGIEGQLRIYRDENIPLFTEIQQKQQQFSAIAGAMNVVLDGQELTLQQASTRLQEPDRTLRERVWHLVQNRRAKDRDALNSLYTELIQLRHQVAVNAGFANFRDYMFVSMGRHDYSPEDCFTFHDAVASAVVPLERQMVAERKSTMSLDALKPWDLTVDPLGRPAQIAFNSGEDLLAKTIDTFEALKPEMADYLRTMKVMGHLDLESRKGKAPGGYNYPLDEIGVPFIFMNATSTVRDMVTMLHEGGHAVHSFVTRTLPLNTFKHTPSEVAELASMSMELLSLDQWYRFFPDPTERRRAKREHLEQILETLPWVACIDAFQHWVYENPNHNLAEREANWLRIYQQFSPDVVDWTGIEDVRAHIWQKQLHLFEVPFYYIEYGMAQLGAVAVWRNYKQNPELAIDQYLAALRLGYTASIGEIYEAAGIKFDFGADNIKSLMAFVQAELDEL